jgi:hypothetical protein
MIRAQQRGTDAARRAEAATLAAKKLREMARDFEHVAPFVETIKAPPVFDVFERDAPVEFVLVEAGAGRSPRTARDRALRAAVGQHLAHAHAERVFIHAGPLAGSPDTR